jgi:cytochrome c556
MKSPLSAAALFAVALAAPLSTLADDQDTAEYRGHIMSSMGELMGALGMIVKNRAPADNFAIHAQTLAIVAATAKKSFEPKAPGGNSKPEVWSQWTDFAKQMDALVASTQDLAKAAKDGGATAAAPKLEATAALCKGCHDTYMVPKK